MITSCQNNSVLIDRWTDGVSRRVERNRGRQQIKSNWALTGTLPVLSASCEHTDFPLVICLRLLSWQAWCQWYRVDEVVTRGLVCCLSIDCVRRSDALQRRRRVHLTFMPPDNSVNHVPAQTSSLSTAKWCQSVWTLNLLIAGDICTVTAERWWQSMKQILNLCWFGFQNYSYLPFLYSEIWN